ncbi:MAG: prepilin-type N-terminal cleavage/methylation protein [Schumannella sp.]|nr:prepilin-type N-terminal cleavage/methylation protein [Schumannella sp.]
MKSDRGFTLIELLVASALSIIVLSIVGGMIISSITTEHTVQESTESSTLAQITSSSITHGVRHASKLSLSAPSGNTQLLRALIVDDALASPVVAHCESWYYAGGTLRTKSSSTAIAVPTGSADVVNWTLLAEGVAPVGTIPVFTLTGSTVDLSMQVTGDRGLTVLIDTTAVSRQPSLAPTEVANLCF